MTNINHNKIQNLIEYNGCLQINEIIMNYTKVYNLIESNWYLEINKILIIMFIDFLLLNTFKTKQMNSFNNMKII